MNVLGLVKLREYAIASVAAATQLGGEGEKAGRHGTAIAAINAGALRRDGNGLRGKPLTTQNRQPTFEPIFRAVPIGKTDTQSAESALSFELEIVARAG